MAEFEVAVAFVLENEGGFNDSPNDRGGATNFGISLRLLRDIPGNRLRKYGIFDDLSYVEAVKALTIDQAKNLYRGEFWDEAPFEKLSSQLIANYVFDCCVQHGMSQGILILQHALWAAYRDHTIVKADGKLGDLTLLAESQADDKLMLSCLIACRDGFIRICAALRMENKEFFDGWINRCYRI